MLRGRLNRALAIGLVLMLSASVLGATDDAKYGPNLLRFDPALTLYHQNNQGVPTFVKGALAPAAGSDLATAAEFLTRNQGAFRIANPAEELRVRKTIVEEDGARHLRLDQYYNGLRVIGADMVAHFAADGSLRAFNGTPVPDLELDVNPAITAAAAIERAEADLKSFFGAGQPGEPELVIFPWEGSIHLAWRLFLTSDTPMGRWEYFVDAKSGEVVYKANRIMNVDVIGTGVGVMGTARNHLDIDYTGSTYQMKNNTRQLTNNPHGHDGQMPAGNYLQTNIASSSLPGTIATDADNVWNAGGSQAAAVDGHLYSALFYDWILDQFNRNSYTGTGTSMLTVVNYSGEGTDNAYWDGQRIVVWANSSGWRSLAGCPDVISHEWGHAVTENESNLIYQKESGALNESFSDMVGAAFEFAYDSLDTPDWLMGENGQTSGAGFRDMSNPHANGDPDYYGTTDPYWVDVVGCSPSPFNDYCGVHTNSGVGNKWFFLLSDGGTHHSITVTGIGVANAIKVAYRANQLYWTSSIDYYNAALATVTAADELDGSGNWATQTSKAWNAVGVAVPLASLGFSYPNGVPTALAPNQPTTFQVVVSGTVGGTPVPNSGVLFYRVNSGLWTQIAMTQTSLNHYDATIPGSSCYDQVDFYVGAVEQTNGLFTDPGATAPFSALVSTGSTVAFADNFQTNLGWTVSSTATAGQWARGIPAGGGDRGDPPSDYDGSGQCYLTGPADGDTDVDGGSTVLTSPTIDLSAGDARISYARWYSNSFGAAPNADVMTISISSNNGTSWTVVETVGPSQDANGGWIEHGFFVSEFVTPTAQVKMKFDVGDLGDGSVVEAAVDAFNVTQYECASTALEITTNDLPDWTVGVPYSQQLTAVNGSGALTWIDGNNGLIGTGLTVSTAGLVSGTPTTAGPISFTAQVTDEASAFDNRNLNFTINPALNITTTTLPEWTAGRPYSQTLAATGGTGPKGWSDKNDDLIGTGLALSAAGVLSGTGTSAGTLGFTAEVQDQIGAAAEKALQVVLNPAVNITTASLPEGVEGEAYSQALTLTGGTGTKTWSDKNNNLAGTGLTLSAAGLLSGTPLAAGTINLTARVVDIAGSTDEQPLTLTVAEPYVCGDADGSQAVNISDAVYLINYIFSGGPAPTPLLSGDADCSAALNISDAVYLINYIFSGGPAPCSNCP